MMIPLARKIGVNVDIKPPIKTQKPYFSIPNGGNEVVKLFIDALCCNILDDAKFYLSRGLRDSVNFDALKEIFNESMGYKCLNKVSFGESAGKLASSSLLVFNRNNDKSDIINLYIIKEPDIYSKWKICGIEPE